MKVVIAIALTWGITMMSFAQVTDAEDDLRKAKEDTTQGWKKGGVVNIAFSQVSLTNWAAGGLNSVSTNGLVSLFANYTGEGNITWDNSLDVGYGIMKQGQKDANWIKTDDRIDFSSKYGKLAKKNWYYAALLNFRTQLTNGYSYPNDSVKISTALAPGYLLGALGMDYKPGDKFSLFIAPLTTKVTIVTDETLSNAGAFGVEGAVYDDLGALVTAGKKIRMEMGGYAKIAYKTTLMENVGFQTKLDLFSNYLNNPQNIDVNWEMLLSMKINKYLSCTLTTQLLYDDDVDISVDNDGDDIADEVGPRVQFKEVFGAGFSYTF